MRLIAGLGNPGRTYEGTPHNLGYLVADRLAARMAIRFRQSASVPGLVAEGRLAGEEAILLKPTTFMNLSGRAVAPLAQDKRLRPEEILVLVDDIDLPFGALRWRCKGGDGGHKGLRSIIRELESDEFVRLRIGILPEERPRDVEAHVLTPFGPREREWVERIAEKAADSVEVAVGRGIQAAANLFNGATIAPPVAQPSE